ncbi:formimidoylglutamase [Aureisphaera galaxeae]|uniref:formimidoylglutamase n=1 Tax=Aureisphaera galaxeae TaxID=1538023 RepID=UPI002350C797|nr:formimidoylglutamase [Aureisphaera galaxeae]MDC8004843.1 formimidoylglutamase [Aureisphaera galaxeae]
MSLIFYNREKLKQHTKWRWGEEKLGEMCGVVDDWEQLAESEANYVLFGIPEDVGVRANYGHVGTSKAWNACLDAICNIQSNVFTNANNVVVLGEIDCSEEMMDAKQLESDDPFFPTKIGSLVKSIDDKVSEIIQKIIALNKIPIAIGGGQNNAYGMIKGVSLSYDKPINCINLDAYSDFTALEHRHSGNGFSYAHEEGYLDKYFILGLLRNYNSVTLLNRIEETEGKVAFERFEDISVYQKTSFKEALQKAKKHVAGTYFGLELDLDTVATMGSSAMTPSGFTLEEARQYITTLSKHKNCIYIHLCEGNPLMENFESQVGKSLAFLISDILGN